MSRKHLIKIGTQTAQLALAAPLVVGHRVNRMLVAGSRPQARDLDEYSRMSAEKSTAFMESWFAMSAETMRANQRLAVTLMISWWKAWFGMAGFALPYRSLQNAALGVVAKGIAPVHSRALANARRLSGVRR